MQAETPIREAALAFWDSTSAKRAEFA